LWIGLVIAVAAGLTVRAATAAATTRVALATALVFAVCLTIRDAPTLRAWNVLAVGIALATSALAARGLRLSSSLVVEYVVGLAAAGVHLILGPVSLVVQDLGGGGESRSRWVELLTKVLLGTVIAFPVLIIFGALLTSADPVFGRLVRSLLSVDLERLVSHAVIIAMLSWAAAGFWSALVTRHAPANDPPALDDRPRLGMVEIGIPLGALSLLFLLFVVVQIGYLFGGEATVRSVPELSYAEYARHGFFELIAVAGLVLPLLLVTDWALDRSKPKAVRSFRALAVLQLLLVGVMLISAVDRLRLYQAAYGLTEARVYATAVMVWIAMGLGWFAATALRGRRDRFVIGPLVSGFLTLAVLNVANPAAIVARTNVSRAVEGAELDLSYLTGLSGDAVPSLTATSIRLGNEDRCTLLRDLRREWQGSGPADWRAWNLDRWRARRATAHLEERHPQCFGPVGGAGDAPPLP
jgi:hypothetical protein